MNLVLADLGNSSIKLCCPELGKQFAPNLPPKIWRASSIESILELPADLPIEVDAEVHCLISSVNAPALVRFKAAFLAKYPQAIFYQVTEQDVPLPSNVASRTQLGIDRLLAGYSARSLASESGPIIVIDAGTAVTIDLVDAAGVFQGGVIFPGAGTSFASLNKATAALPDAGIELSKKTISLDSPLGKTTEEAIVRGVLQAQASACRGIVERIAAQQALPCTVFASGGELELLKPILPEDWMYLDELVTRGMILIAQRKFG